MKIETLRMIDLPLRIAEIPGQTVAMSVGVTTRTRDRPVPGKVCAVERLAARAHGQRFRVEPDAYLRELRL